MSQSGGVVSQMAKCCMGAIFPGTYSTTKPTLKYKMKTTYS